MSILLLDPDEELGGAIVDRLVTEGDEVRVLVRAPGEWKARGAYVAIGDPMDADLVERACTNVRTIVFTFGTGKVAVSTVAAAIPPALVAGSDRVVICTPAPDDSLVSVLDASGTSYVLLITGRRGFLPRKSIEPERVAEAVSAADDLAGEPKLTVDLTDQEGWAKLGGHA